MILDNKVSAILPISVYTITYINTDTDTDNNSIPDTNTNNDTDTNTNIDTFTITSCIVSQTLSRISTLILLDTITNINNLYM